QVETMAWLPGAAASAGAGPETAGTRGAGAARLTAVELVSPAGLVLATEEGQVETRSGRDARQRPNADPEHGYHVSSWTVAVPAGAPATAPYFLERPLDGALYDWSGAPPEVRGEPFGPPPVAARFHVEVAGVPLTLEREVTWRFRDQALGEVREPLRVVPPVTVALTPDLLVWPTDRQAPRRLTVALASHARQPLAGRLEVAVPPGWPAVAPVPFELAPGGTAERALEVAAPAGLAPGEHRVEVAAVVGTARYAADFPQVAGPHIRTTPYPEPAQARVAALDLALPPLSRVGYVRGASDRVPEALLEVGVPLVLLAAEDLASGDLDRFDAVVVGSRAYETDPALAEANERLLDYARRGGLLIVQYQQYAFVEGGFAPLPLEIGRPHGRITDEAAPVRLLAPEHPLFHLPNELGPADWQGWVQERALYMPATFDSAYLPLLAMRDPDQPEQLGAVLVAPLGEGTYVYTGLAFFRQLPAGVPGAYRLFANLLALGGRGD
ncbi:MAG TPA: NEW3 domain-containing protein, partial [Thermoanaerobaculia bacterium]|nr:NEW3 domain-containing protein [Thermoanaerobaculia bacterium]